MRPGHRSARQVRVGRVTAGVGRAHVHPGRRNIRLKAIRPVTRDRPAAAEARKRVGDVNRPGGEGSLVHRRRVIDRRAGRTVVACRRFDENARCLSILEDYPQLIAAAFADRANPTIVDHMRAQRWIGVLSVEICRSYEELKALGVSGRHAIALVHITAADPLCPGSQPSHTLCFLRCLL